MLEVVTPATNFQLTTLGAVKGELEISVDTYDAIFTSLIDRASKMIVGECGRPFAYQTYRETLPGYGDYRLMLSRTPIVGTPTILCDSEAITDFVVEERDAGFLWRKTGWKWTVAPGWHITWAPVAGSEDLKFIVSYNAGYVLPGDVGTRTLPEDIEQACIQAVKAWFLARKRDPRIESESIGDYQVKYTPGKLPLDCIQMVNPWRRLF